MTSGSPPNSSDDDIRSSAGPRPHPGVVLESPVRTMRVKPSALTTIAAILGVEPGGDHLAEFGRVPTEVTGDVA